MKKYVVSFLLCSPILMMGQSAVDGFRFSQSDLKGTARFMSMGGAFGALGGDVSVITQNPGGIGVYRTQDISLTMDLDMQHAVSSGSVSPSLSTDQTKFLLNNVGAVFSFNTNNYLFPNFNLGLSFHKTASFNRSYSGNIGNLKTSLSNYIAGVSNQNMVTDDALNSKDAYSSNLPWISILGYDGYLIYPTGNEDMPEWIGQWDSGRTSGSGQFSIVETGAVDEYNIAFGGNIADVVFWGMDFGITNLSFTQQAFWGENLKDALIDEAFVNSNVSYDSNLVNGRADWGLVNNYRASGTGFNYKLGLIFKPIQELRIGLAFHTPTWYSIKETFNASLNTRYGQEQSYSTEVTNGGYDGYNEYNFRTPWKFIVSAATVIGSRFILSADYQMDLYKTMKFSTYNNALDYYDYEYGYYDDPYDYYWGTRANTGTPAYLTDPFYYTNEDIKAYYKTMHTIRVGAEYRITPRFSARAGVAHSFSPVTEKTLDNRQTVYTSGTQPSYQLNNSTTYLSCGLGYRYQKFYADIAYQYKHLSADYHAYTPDPQEAGIATPQSSLSLNDSNVVLTLGFRF